MTTSHIVRAAGFAARRPHLRFLTAGTTTSDYALSAGMDRFPSASLGPARHGATGHPCSERENASLSSQAKIVRLDGSTALSCRWRTSATAEPCSGAQRARWARADGSVWSATHARGQQCSAWPSVCARINGDEPSSAHTQRMGRAREQIDRAGRLCRTRECYAWAGS